jgi:hypothetical protein
VCSTEVSNDIIAISDGYLPVDTPSFVDMLLCQVCVAAGAWLAGNSPVGTPNGEGFGGETTHIFIHIHIDLDICIYIDIYIYI